jgi:hypothetical protein
MKDEDNRDIEKVKTLHRILGGLENCIENAYMRQDRYDAAYMKSMRDDLLTLLTDKEIDEFYFREGEDEECCPGCYRTDCNGECMESIG